ncbi:MAG: hypothetical protein GWN18_04770 [Thermoplasmata archaeon]|nr:hypothetical protein [Thermoplasmata archaeon]NIS19276.1 hypothetical protein [Thermoplasmata archaeon]NIT76364.1 hypothetical protein [Thermoplasmata archaeon]NIU48409.1 hypothetical protein [Thermoplasmata archaeon]NIV78041.1 hypothetical protein [Thermoplasmata archaeon]
MDYLLNVNQVNTITITATDEAGNMVSQEIVVEHQHLKDPGDEFDWGLVILLVGIILLALAIFVGWRRLSAHEEEQEIEVEEEEVLAPAAMPEVEEELELEEEEEEILIEEDDEEIHELTPPEERPRTDTSRPAYEGAEEEVTIEIDEKDLEEKDAEGDVEADELEQEEGI